MNVIKSAVSLLVFFGLCLDWSSRIASADLTQVYKSKSKATKGKVYRGRTVYRSENTHVVDPVTQEKVTTMPRKQLPRWKNRVQQQEAIEQLKANGAVEVPPELKAKTAKPSKTRLSPGTRPAIRSGLIGAQ